MIALVTAVFVASLTGSLHCAGMCGPFVALAVGSGSRRAAQLAYNGGRLVSYVALGAAAGAFGAALDLGGAWLGVQRVALVAAGAAMIAFGTLTLLRAAGIALPLPGAPGLVQRAYRAAFHRVASLPVVPRALGIGLCSTLLPCGWLYAFVITAAGTGSAAGGALAMAVFWSGTLPVMLALGLGVQRLAGPLAARVPTLTAAALIVVGIVAVAGRFAVAPPDLAAAAQAGPGAAIERAAELDPAEACPLHP